MAAHIRVTCHNCNRVIKAPRSAAGKRGKCPHCQHSVYIPTPADEREEIPLAPVNEEAEAEAEKLRREERELIAALQQEVSEPHDTKAPGKEQPPEATGRSVRPPLNITESIVDYLVAMHASNLEKANQIVEQLTGRRQETKSRIQQLIVDPIVPAPVRDMPSGLYQGFLRKLLEQLESS